MTLSVAPYKVFIGESYIVFKVRGKQSIENVCAYPAVLICSYNSLAEQGDVAHSPF